MRARAALLAAVRAHASAAPARAGCRSDGDCSFNGVCAGGACACDPQWTGADCGRLALLPASPQGGMRVANTSSWGASLVADGGQYHLFASLFRDGCGLTQWKSNSEVVHATSPAPGGAYTPAGVVLPAFAHNPELSRLNATHWALAHIGCSGGIAAYTNCTNGSTPGVYPLANTTNKHAGVPGDRPRPAVACDTPHYTGVRVAASLAGPWSPPEEVAVVSGHPSPWWGASPMRPTNPSLLPLSDGSVLLAYAAGVVARNGSAGGGKNIGVAAAASWRGPYVDLTPEAPIFRPPTFIIEKGHAIEDPFLWRDARGRFHLLAHTDYNMPHWHAVAAHAASVDAAAWRVSASAPYTRTIEWDGGGSTEVYSRERPKLLLQGGVPAALVNGVEPGNVSTPWARGGRLGDSSYTHVQLVRQNRPRRRTPA